MNGTKRKQLSQDSGGESKTIHLFSILEQTGEKNGFYQLKERICSEFIPMLMFV